MTTTPSVFAVTYNQGPFPGRIDPWAEDARYFQQIHAGMIDEILDQIQLPLSDLGYFAGREASLQIVANRKPDVFVERKRSFDTATKEWNYETQATQVLAEPGTAVFTAPESEWQAIHIQTIGEGELVTVIELISPRNKTHPEDVRDYQYQREALFLQQGVNVVEIDATRSVKRLLTHPLTMNSSYHIAVHFPAHPARAIVSAFEEPLKRFALPLRYEVLPVQPQDAYNRAYRRAGIVAQIDTRSMYAEIDLPFPTLLTGAQKQDALDRVARWRDELARLKVGG